MKYNPLEARTVFVDGPVAIYIHDAPHTDVSEAFLRLRRLVDLRVAMLAGDQALENEKKRLQQEALKHQLFGQGANDAN